MAGRDISRRCENLRRTLLGFSASSLYTEKKSGYGAMGEPVIKDVLLVEDNPGDIYLMQAAVREYGNDLRLWLVTDGLDALSFLRQESPYLSAPSPALIILDINLPGMHGTEVLAELRHFPAYQATPVVMFSTARRDLEGPHCLQLGANAYVEKPYDLEAFLAAVHGILRDWLPQDGS
jgi:CheY-like chemotaxis protein